MENQETIIENNRLIAVFDGWVFSKTGKTARKKAKDPRSAPYRLSDLHYNNDWNLLMPVVEKIKKISMPFPGIIDINKFDINFQQWNNPFWHISIVIKCYPDHENQEYIYHTITAQKSDMLEAVYTAVTEFIKWFNQQARK